MHLILCIDERNGMSFAGRRQSRDRQLLEDILALVGDACLWMSPYSGAMFGPGPNIRVAEDYLTLAGEGEYCFCERELPEGNIESIILYRWNRRYPADLYLPQELLDSRLPVQAREFSGHSHETITREVYVL